MTTVTDEVPRSVGDSALPTVDVEIVVPVYNEQEDIGPSVRRLHEFLARDPGLGRPNGLPRG